MWVSSTNLSKSIGCLQTTITLIASNSLISLIHQNFTLDYFEIERLIEDLAKLYCCSCATSWFKVEGKLNPTKDEFRNKVVEFMDQFEHTLSSFPNSPQGEKFKKYTRELLQKESMLVIRGDNKDVEKRYGYFVNSR